MTLEVVINDLLKMPKEYVIAHAIDSHEVAFGAGASRAICEMFPDIREKCLEFANDNFNCTNFVYRYTNGEQVIYNMFVKSHCWYNAMNKMTQEEYLNNVKTCLTFLKKEMIMRGEKHLAIPQIGCGLDRCRWKDIEAIINFVFEDTDIDVKVCMV